MRGNPGQMMADVIAVANAWDFGIQVVITIGAVVATLVGAGWFQRRKQRDIRTAIGTPNGNGNLSQMSEKTLIAQREMAAQLNDIRQDFLDHRAETREGFRNVNHDVRGLRLDVTGLRSDLTQIRADVEDVQAQAACRAHEAIAPIVPAIIREAKP